MTDPQPVNPAPDDPQPITVKPIGDGPAPDSAIIDMSQHTVQLASWNSNTMTATFTIDKGVDQFSMSFEGTFEVTDIVQQIKDRASVYLSMSFDNAKISDAMTALVGTNL